MMTEGLAWLLLAAVLAGIVRGFSGFGTALVFLPVAARFLDPFSAITVLILMDLIGPLPNLPAAWRQATRADLLWLGLGLLVGLPAGIAVLAAGAPELFRWAVSGVSLLMLVLLGFGWRYRGAMGRGMTFGTGFASGLLGGAAGVPGPPVILVYMASARPVAAIRATILVFLVLVDVTMLGMFAGAGRLVFGALGLGALLAAPYLLANVAGARAFRPERAGLYRGAAYTIIAGSALSGLPLWG